MEELSMWFDLFFRGLFLGVAASIPLGPVGILCIQRTLSKRLKSGFISGLGAATADLIFASAAFFSLAMITEFLERNQLLFTLIGGACIVFVGVNIFFTNPDVQIRRNRTGTNNYWKDYISVFFVTLANPAFILVYVALFATFGLSNDMGRLNGAAMLTGVFAGCALWWLILTSTINLVRRRFTRVHLLWMNRIAGCAIAVLGLGAVSSVLIKYIMNELL